MPALEATQKSDQFNALCDHFLIDEGAHIEKLRHESRLTESDRADIAASAITLIETCRNKAGGGSVFDAFLQEYGLSSDEGVTLMRLAEALIRTPDIRSAQLLLRDKLSDHDWKSHVSQSSSPLVNATTHGIIFSSEWIHLTGGTAAKGLLQKLGDSVLFQGVRSAMGVMSRHFVLGKDIEQAIEKSAPFERDGFAFSYDMLGEAALTKKDAERYRQNYQHAVETLAKQQSKYTNIKEAPGLSVKLSALHPRYEYTHRDWCVKSLVQDVKQMAITAKRAGMGLTIDAEEANRLEISLIIVEELLNDPDLANWEGLSVVVQAYQRRAYATIKHLLTLAQKAGRRFAIRLVKGAYWDSEIKHAQELGLESYPVFTRKENTDISYLACAKLLLANTHIVFPQFATHNAATAAAILHMAKHTTEYEFQRLYGMGELLHKELMAKASVKSRIYAPVGAHKDLLPYLVRRLLENGANSSFVHQLLNKEIEPSDIARDPIAQSLAHKHAQNPAIPMPRDLFDGDRLSARGLDWTQSNVAHWLENLPRSMPSITAKSIVNGIEQPGQCATIRNPAANNDIVGEWHVASPEIIPAAVEAAKENDWKNWKPTDRAACLMKAANLLEEGIGEFMGLCVREAGKSWPDAIAEVREAVDFCRYYANQGASPDFKDREALGTILCISPWNFPLAIFLGQVAASLVAGNAVICKPAEQTPLIAHKTVHLLLKAGVPKDALHLLMGDGPTLGAALVATQDIDGVCFTGSTKTAKNIVRTLADTGRPLAPVIAETGGLNAMIIDSTALLEQAVGDVVASAFQSAGQRCSACRFVCVQDDIADDFIEMLGGAMSALNVGDPARLSTDIGPVIDENAQRALQAYCQDKSQTWKVIGQAPLTQPELTGHYISPIAFEVPSVGMLDEERFGPILHVVRYKAKDLDDVIDQINGLGYGLTMGVHSRIDSRVNRISERAKVGNLYVNRNQIGAVVGVQPFGGEGLSGTGPKAGGPSYLKRLSQRKITNPILETTAEPVNISGLDAINSGATIATLLQTARTAQTAWLKTDRDALLARAQEKLLSQKLYANELETTTPSDIALPGPTGETNRLSHHPRGVIAVFGGNDLNLITAQILRVISTGSAAIAAIPSDVLQQFEVLEGELIALGAPSGLLQTVLFDELGDLLAADIDGIMLDGPDKETLGKRACHREGSILPILSVGDEIERFFIERTRTDDTTAAGGNASLLAL